MSPPDNRQHGIISRLVTDRGFGFIVADQIDYFFHHTTLENCTLRQLRLGDQVSFISTRTDRGTRAESVTLLRDPLRP